MIGILLMAHGTPAGPQEIPSFLESIRSHKPSQAELDDLARRYEAIGGMSPLTQLTEVHRDNLVRVLDKRYPGRFVVATGMKHAKPSIEDSLASLEQAGAASIIGVALAPHYSRASIGDYENRVRTAIRLDPNTAYHATFRMVKSWHLAPGLIELWSGRVKDTVIRLQSAIEKETGGESARQEGSARQERSAEQERSARQEGPAGQEKLDAGSPDDPGSTGNDSAVHVIFTAHSLPARLTDQGDPYARQVNETAAAIAKQAGLEHWSVAWQSTPVHVREPWLEPDVKDAISTLAGAGRKAVAVCPVGFVSDHLETLYDLDIVARESANIRGIAFDRCRSLDHDIGLAEVLASVAYGELGGSEEVGVRKWE
ncbi:MAG: ferrochelatase [Actinobacteria bacterium]|nr:ferrochelatase [Actinomycetota bacterium]MCL5447157.1 ferrochelatase [Actinomycetota bacterium]